ncbi:hypothetical protein Scep_015041 [Stephania cephalantha]|uniref:Uncharacterized protein n=1 Tax=Stephania cephalantha TaxID=152367 RepID=A0AAP0J3U9_9MAGN
MEWHASKVYHHGKNDEKLEMNWAYYVSDNLRVCAIKVDAAYISNTAIDTSSPKVSIDELK